MNLSNELFGHFHYRSYGTFFYNKIGSIISIGDLPTTNIIEPFFIYNKESSDLNRYMRGRELIRQLTHDSKHIPRLGRPTIASLKEKISEVNLLIDLNINNQSYQEIKTEVIKDIAQLDLTIIGKKKYYLEDKHSCLTQYSLVNQACQFS